MSRLNVHVILKADTSRFEAALRKINRSMMPLALAFRRVGRSAWRVGLTPGERHIDRMCREVAGQSNAALRLECAVLLAEVLDRGEAS